MEVLAHLNNLRISPRKVRLLAALVKGLPLTQAISALEFRSQRASRPLRKLILAAAADAEHNFKLKKDDLVIKQILVNSDLTIKRYMPRAFGRAAMIRKRGSRVTVALTSRTGSKIAETSVAPAAETKPKQLGGESKDLPTVKKTRSDKADTDKPKSFGGLRSRLFNRKTG